MSRTTSDAADREDIAAAAPAQGAKATSRNKAAYVRREVAKGQSRPHTCHARDCGKQVPPAYFMCAKHWRMVPRHLQTEVWRHYQPGQEKGDARPSPEYLRVVRDAIEVVAAKEGKPTPRRRVPAGEEPRGYDFLDDETDETLGEGGA